MPLILPLLTEQVDTTCPVLEKEEAAAGSVMPGRASMGGADSHAAARPASAAVPKSAIARKNEPQAEVKVRAWCVTVHDRLLVSSIVGCMCV